MTIQTVEVGEVVPAIPAFEGKPVDSCLLKLVNSPNLDLSGVVLHVDDIIKIVVEARVVGVNHVVHEPTGTLVRLQTAKPIDAHIEPFNPEYDNGVIRDDR